MNHTNPLEKQLESWVPRRPSPALKERIFAQANATELKTNGFSHPFAHLKSRLSGHGLKFAPVVCMLLAVLILNAEHRQKSTYLAVAGGSNVLAGLSSNLLAFGATDPRELRENVWTAVTFDWTKDGQSLSTTGSFPSGSTNGPKL